MSAIKQRVAAISIAASAGMAAVKFAVGVAIGSIALISEALHSSVDLIATVITWIVVRISDKPADAGHHYGHGKLESLSARRHRAALHSGGGIVVEAYSRLREGAAPPTPSAIPFVVLVDIAVNYWRARALHRTAMDTRARRWKPTRCICIRRLRLLRRHHRPGLSALAFRGGLRAAIAVAVLIALLGLKLGKRTIERPIRRRKARPRKPRSRSARCPASSTSNGAGAHGRRAAFHRAIVQVPRLPIDRVEEIKQRRSRRPQALATQTSPSPRCRWRATMRACASASW